MPRTAARTFLAALGAAGTLLAVTGTASAHVTVTPTTVPAGTDTTLTFRVPDERSDVSTTGLKIVLADGGALHEESFPQGIGWHGTIQSFSRNASGGRPELATKSNRERKIPSIDHGGDNECCQTGLMAVQFFPAS